MHNAFPCEFNLLHNTYSPCHMQFISFVIVKYVLDILILLFWLNTQEM